MSKDRGVSILGPDGNPVMRHRPRSRALAGGSDNYMGPPYDAADASGPHMSAWMPGLWSPDAELNIYRDRIVSRVRDVVRNDGWASGVVTRILDNTIGASIRPIAKPDHRFLAYYSGNKAFDSEWAKDFSRQVDACWRLWALDGGRWCDATRNSTFGQLMRLGFRHKLIDGDVLAVMQWLPERVGTGRARYATAVQMVDPDRLSNPQQMMDSQYLRGGVEIDDYGSAVAYHIRKAHMGDWWDAANAITWERVPREDGFGRPVMVHDYDVERAAQHRGGAGIFTPVLQRLKMLVKYDGVELDSAILNAIFAAYVESPFDRDLVAEALDDGEQVLPTYQSDRLDYHDIKKISIGNARLPLLFPGEKINAVTAARPNSNFRDFESAVLRNFAAGVGLSAQQVSNDWSDVNYSSARGALLEAWKTLDRRRDDFAAGFAGPIRSAWMEEAMAIDDLPMPKGVVPDFVECRSAYARCRWMGPGRGWVDPVAEKQGAVIGMDAALSTLEDECAQQNLDFEEVLEQREYEIGLFKKYGIPLPAWVGAMEVQVGGGGDLATPTKPPGSSMEKVKKPQAE